MISKNITKFNPIITIRHASTGRPEVKSALPSRPMKRIQIGKARPAIYHKFNSFVELSDGSVISRRTQYPKDELRMITDQRNNPIWNQSKPNVSLLDAESKGKLNKFNTKFAQFEQSETGVITKKSDDELVDDYLDILGSNYVEKKLGGKMAQKEKGKKRK
ncbi:hypothetical protein CANARDRAFT_230089 [[Candida] arabinofermentans NRRL YB-2248]|uniref:Ribosomal protein bL31m N-terminal domain-containing protein n=1 Tax=[Candida] arabinofermentans NRRL YB-2248 TaxID=983967 RepID=A0A1E4T6W4_9ASCO|nr:hypothetical protein CANARDRAFT_230089 [[Candida] arabinofermentans NRRL YB-2248]